MSVPKVVREIKQAEDILTLHYILESLGQIINSILQVFS